MKLPTRTRAALLAVWGVLMLVGKASAESKGPEWGPPQWERGMVWSVAVRTAVRRMEETEGGDVQVTHSTSAPRIWDFQVAAREDLPGFPATRFDLVAAPREGGEPPVQMSFIARIYQGEVAVLAMESVRYGTPGGVVERSFRDEFHEPAPVLFQGAPIPVSFPRILLGQVGEKTFSKTRMVGDLPFADDVIQEVLDGDQARQKAEAKGMAVGDDGVWYLRVFRSLDRESLEQIWFPGDPWPAWTRAGPLEATLIH